jgi:hypothetical protein
VRTSLLASALAASLAFAAPGHAAAPKPQITDPAGDAKPGTGAGFDVVSALFHTQGTTAKVRGKKVYTPSKLLVTVTYAGPVSADPYAAQIVAFDAPGCASVYLESYAGGTTYGTADCLADSFEFSVTSAGNTQTFAIPFALIGKTHLKKGAALTGLTTYTALADPVVGYESVEVAGQAADTATTAAPYTIA